MPDNKPQNMPEIRLFNSMTRKKEIFRPLDPDNVRIYVCGPTVYDRAHIGNARPVIVFDMLYRLLRHVYGEDHVTYARNFTDVDDKIIKRAAETGRQIDEITEETIAWYHDDMEALGTLRPDVEPRATLHIANMIAMIEELISGGHAYEAEGHVLFAVDSYAAYGRLSGRSVKDMIAGARVEVAPYKRNPMDFVLWKPSTPNQPGWDSPWGRGRPGWHIECSAMSYELFGPRFDIHGGGGDLKFPHHENEIAQSCCAHPGDDGCFAQVWMHNEMLQVEGKKMSKSLGNFFSVRELLDQGIPGEVIRFVYLGTHYRKPMDWTENMRRTAHRALFNIYEKYEEALHNLHSGVISENFPEWKHENLPKPALAIVEAIANDLNTAEALRLFREHARDADPKSRDDQRQVLANGLFLGFFGGTTLAPAITTRPAVDLEPLAHRLEALRKSAKETRDFSELDRLKAALIAAGVEVRMGKDGVDLVAGPDFDPAKLEGLE